MADLIDADLIDIVCGIDSNYAPHLAVMLKSLTRYNPKYRFKVHVLNDAVPDELRRRVEGCNKEIEINWINIDYHCLLELKGFLHISRATYLRLMMIEVLDPALKRVLYLDVDMIINGDILPLWTTPLGDKACAAVVDPGVNPGEFAKKWHLSGKGPYFNSGVMLFDLDKLRSKPYMEQAIKIATSPDHSLEYADQDALNIVLWNDWLAIDPRWNFQRKFLYNNYTDWNALAPQEYQPAIIHYTESCKPWKKTEWHPCGWLYLRALLKTPFKASILKSGEINFYHICKSWLKWTLKRPPMFTLKRQA
jgi:lipopolysaccharide biosynthesis glycosyltransferase